MNRAIPKNESSDPEKWIERSRNNGSSDTKTLQSDCLKNIVRLFKCYSPNKTNQNGEYIHANTLQTITFRPWRDGGTRRDFDFYQHFVPMGQAGKRTI